jgi:predicted CXXCH cytochrome family protein
MKLYSIGLLVTLHVYFANLCEASDQQTQCLDCHASIVDQWSSSDHGNAMNIASEQTVLGDFNNQTVTHFSQKARFFKNQNKFQIEFSENNQTDIYSVKYVFGHHPLQQYLIPTNDGKYQVFPFAWDARKIDEGGQRWYPIYPSEDILKDDRLHWLQPMQNWNGMCADCHSSGLIRNFSSETHQFETQLSHLNVSCSSCHGDKTKHSQKYKAKVPNTSNELSKIEKSQLGNWLFGDGDKIAHWEGQPRDNSFMDTCFACHSLRSPLTDGIDPHKPYLDQFSPSFLTPPLYYEDGQIKEEVYVYGSFLQSKMYAAGVNCLDCHNAHTMQLKIEGNGLCLQCHSSQAYQTESHTHHNLKSSGGQCVNCHMPASTFMGIDSRRDHSFVIPKPTMSKRLNSPLACLNCHTQENHDWADKIIKSWFDNSTSISEIEYSNVMKGKSLSKNQIFELINKDELSVIKKASLITTLPNHVKMLTDIDIKNYINSNEPLIRLAVAQIGTLLPPIQRKKSFKQLLTDSYKAIRIAAVGHLINLGLDDKSFKDALNELTYSNKINRWRGEGNLNQSLIQYQLGNSSEAISLLEFGIDTEPYFAPNYINLAELYRTLGLLKKERETLLEGIEANPTNAIMYHSYGMHQIRAKNADEALSAFQKALELSPETPRNWYIYALALDNVGDTQQAISVLKNGLKLHQDASLKQLGINLSHKAHDDKSLIYFSK